MLIIWTLIRFWFFAGLATLSYDFRLARGPPITFHSWMKRHCGGGTTLEIRQLEFAQKLTKGVRVQITGDLTERTANNGDKILFVRAHSPEGRLRKLP